MARTLTAGMLTEFQAVSLRPVFFYEGEFVSGGSPAFLRLWSGVGSITWNGQTWIGAGNLLGFSPVEETKESRATGFSVSLSGMPSANISVALGQCRQGKPGKVWIGAMTVDGAVIADPFLMRQGRLDVPSVEDSGVDCRISIQYEDRLVALERPNTRRFTHEDLQLSAPGDLGAEFINSLIESVDVWGSPPKPL